MKRFKSLSVKNKRALVIAGVSVVALGVVGTIAFNRDSMFFANLFRLPSDVVEFSEAFDSPNDWQPCQEIPKTAIATNKNASPRYVRMKINEYWRAKNTQTPTTDHETTDLDLTWTDNGVEKHYAVINTQNDDKWELGSDGWYYYKTTLAQDESTDSLLKSVTFNCEVNTVGEIRYSVDGTVGETIPSDYAEANYHLFITFQMSDESMAPSQHTADCSTATELYDLIACRTNGPDTNVRFTAVSSEEGVNGWGVNTLSAHMNDYYPVYYFRGARFLHNNVIWNGICWKIIRTTDTGGVKMSFAGYPDNGTCDDYQWYNYQNSSIVSSPIPYSNYRYTAASVGWMFGGYADPTSPSNISGVSYNYRDEVYYGNDVEWRDGKYYLIDVIHGSFNNVKSQVADGHHYVCFSGEDSCQGMVGYIVGYGSEMAIYPLYGGNKLDDLKNILFANSYDSVAKSTVDSWFNNRITNKRDELEDTIFCNDRSVVEGVLKSKDENSTTGAIFGPSKRVFEKGEDGDYHPSVDCPNQHDAFTVNDTVRGNGDLTYPVGIMTIDEAMLVGIAGYNESSESMTQWFSGMDDWTMSPAAFYGAGSVKVFAWYGEHVYDSYIQAGLNYMIRPVVSLKPGIVVSSGNGDGATPYVIAQ